MAAVGSINQRPISGAAGALAVGDVSRALWFVVSDATGVPVAVFFSSTLAVSTTLPVDTTMGPQTAGQGYHTRQQCGSLFLSRLFITGDGIQTYTVTSFDMNDETYGLITLPLG